MPMTLMKQREAISLLRVKQFSSPLFFLPDKERKAPRLKRVFNNECGSRAKVIAFIENTDLISKILTFFYMH